MAEIEAHVSQIKFNGERAMWPAFKADLVGLLCRKKLFTSVVARGEGAAKSVKLKLDGEGTSTTGASTTDMKDAEKRLEAYGVIYGTLNDVAMKATVDSECNYDGKALWEWLIAEFEAPVCPQLECAELFVKLQQCVLIGSTAADAEVYDVTMMKLFGQLKALKPQMVDDDFMFSWFTMNLKEASIWLLWKEEILLGKRNGVTSLNSFAQVRVDFKRRSRLLKVSNVGVSQADAIALAVTKDTGNAVGRKANGNLVRGCLYCKALDHTVENCPKLKDVECHYCHQKGHMARACPQLARKNKDHSDSEKVDVMRNNLKSMMEQNDKLRNEIASLKKPAGRHATLAALTDRSDGPEQHTNSGMSFTF